MLTFSPHCCPQEVKFQAVISSNFSCSGGRNGLRTRLHAQCVSQTQFWASNHHITLPSNSTSTPRIIAHGSFLLLSVRSCKELITCTPNSFHQGLEMHSSLAISEGFLIFFELDHLLFMSVMIRPSEST